jgi:hypothetical protein
MSVRLALAACALSLAVATPAAADVLSVRAEVHAGAAGGAGVAGGGKEHAFAKGARGATYGALLGAEILFVDAWVEHHQFTDGSLSGTWTQFMTGFDVDVELGKRPAPAGSKPGTKGVAGKGFFEAGLAIGFGLGTGQQVTLPLDNAQLTDKGFLVEARLGGGYNLNRVMAIGVTVPISYGYLFKSGPGVAANDDDNQYQQLQAALMVNVRFRLKAK